MMPITHQESEDSTGLTEVASVITTRTIHLHSMILMHSMLATMIHFTETLLTIRLEGTTEVSLL
jgi:hypothetical protein